jgi:acyl carrier protein
MENDIIYKNIKKILITEFQMQDNLIEPEKLLYDDLGFDSLDAVDLVIILKNQIGVKMNPVLLKNAKTVMDMVEILRPIWNVEQEKTNQ